MWETGAIFVYPVDTVYAENNPSQDFLSQLTKYLLRF